MSEHHGVDSSSFPSKLGKSGPSGSLEDLDKEDLGYGLAKGVVFNVAEPFDRLFFIN